MNPQNVQTSAQILAGLPAALAAATDKEVLNVAASAVSSTYPQLGYIRVLLVSQNYSPSQLLELCSNPKMAPMMAEASSIFSSTGSGVSAGAGGGNYNNSQQAAMRQGMAVFTPQLSIHDGDDGDDDDNNNTGQQGPQDYTDWRVLQQQFGMQSFAAVPLMVAGTVHGVILAASSTPNTFNPGSLHSIRTVANMLAPYAAVLYKYQQIQSTRGMPEQLLPPRVVAAAMDRLSAGGNSAVDVFVPTHHDFQPG